MEHSGMNELVFLAGLATGIAIGVPVVVRWWRTDLRNALRRA